MQLQQNCPVCLIKHQKHEAKLRASVPADWLDTSLLPKLKPVTIVKEIILKSGKLLIKYSCGHSKILDQITPAIVEDTTWTSLTKGYQAYDFQKTGVEFVRNSGFNALIADEMGLGKTVQALLAFRESIKELSPAIFIVKASTIYQWTSMFGEWCSQDGLSIQPILSSKNPIIPIFNAYLVSMDLLPDILDKIIALKPKLVVADEVQSFKNPGAARSKALVKLIQKGNVQHKIFLSGTPIKNRAGEYFTILNLLAPGHFPSWKSFVYRWLEPEMTKSGATIYRRLRKYVIDDFRNLTARWIIRREAKEVQADLPEICYNYQEIEITDPLLKNSYNAQLDLFSNWLNDPSEKKTQMGLLGWLARMRHETALAKMNQVTELAKEFLDSTEENNTKLAIGIHHCDVRDMLHYGLTEYGALKLSGEDSSAEKDMIKTRFQTPENRVLVINEASGGVGMDGLQVCSNVLLMERQWSPADEEQFIKRFNRDRSQLINDGIMSIDEAKIHTSITYVNARGTIDQFFHDQNETKKIILKEAYGNWNIANDTESLMDLARTVVEHRL